MYVQTQRNTQSRQDIKLSELLLRLNIEEIDIYKQAYLEANTPFIMATPHQKTKNEIGVEFKLSGEIDGKIYCYLDLYQKELEANQVNFFNALYIESMNILAGQILTRLNLLEKINLRLSHPTFRTTESPGDELNDNLAQIAAGYKLITGVDEYDCRVIFEVSKEHV